MKRILITVSGGRTSGYMAIRLWKKYKHMFDMRFVFANSSQEHEKTLEFVHNIEKKFGLPIIWIEAKVDPVKGKGTTYTITNFKKAKRKGEVFEEVIKKYGLPSMVHLHCTRELKINPMLKLCKDLGCEEQALGIRVDELNRYNPRKGFIHPLIEMFPCDKKKILKWWKKQKFDLEIPEHLGNCTWCYKKSDTKLNKLVAEHPEVFDFPLKMEDKYKNAGSGDGDRKIFRGKRTAGEVLAGVQAGETKDSCAEECGSYIPEGD